MLRTFAGHPAAPNPPGIANSTNIVSHLDDPLDLATQELESWQVA